MEEDGCEFYSGEEEEEDTFISTDVYDPVYEFDAVRFFDFSRPETHEEAREAERWFDSAPSYSPSPFIIKLDRNWQWSKADAHPRDAYKTCSPTSFKDEEGAYFTCSGTEYSKESEISSSEINTEGSSKVGRKSSSKSSSSRSSTLLKPTASYLAKLNQNQEIHFQRLLRSSTLLNHAPKRQKLEAGYLRKQLQYSIAVAHLKQSTRFPHKLSRKEFEQNVGLTRVARPKPKVTVPREPHLETALRAKRHRLKNSSGLAEHTISNYSTSKACQVAAKAVNISDSPSVSQNETTGDLRSTPEDDPEQEKCAKTNKFRVYPPNKKDSKSLIEKVHPHPPIDLFQKLSLTSEAQQSRNFRLKLPQHAKVLKENAPKVLQAEVEANYELKLQVENNMKDKSQRFGGKQSKCAREFLISEMEYMRSMNSFGH